MYKPTLLNFSLQFLPNYRRWEIKKKQILVRTCFKRGSLPKSGPLDFTTSFPSFFVGEEALVDIY